VEQQVHKEQQVPKEIRELVVQGLLAQPDLKVIQVPKETQVPKVIPVLAPQEQQVHKATQVSRVTQVQATLV